MNEPPAMCLREFYNLCEAHDWTYQYSDDGDVYRAGQEEYKRISSLKLAFPEKQQMYTDFYRYHYNRGPKPIMPS